MTSVKDKIIIGLAVLPKNPKAIDLIPYAHTDTHNITHVLYAMQKQGLVIFARSKHRRKSSVVQNIRLTPKGQEYLEKLNNDLP